MTTATPAGARPDRDDDQAALERARQESRNIEKTLRESKRVRRDVLPRLKRAGLLR